MGKLLIEQYTDYQVLYEAEGDKKSLFIEGVFMMADIKNRNGRIYPKHVMAKEVNRYIAESVSKRNAFGELNHPPTPQINLDRVSHMIVDLREDGSNYIGKAKILETPMGLIAKSIIEGGGQLAVSSRGTGSVRNIGGVMQVQEDFRLVTAADIVSTPSAPAAYVDAIMEAPDWIYNEATGEWYIAEAMKDIHNSKPSRLDEEQALAILDKWLKGFAKQLNESMHRSTLDSDFKRLGLEYLPSQSSGEVSGYWANPKGKGVSARALHQLLKSKGWKLSQVGGSGSNKWNVYTSDKPTPYTETSVIFTYDGDKVKLVHHKQHLDRS